MLMETKKEKWKVQELSLVDNPNLQNIDEYAYFYSKSYYEIFGKTKKNTTGLGKLQGYIKISNGRRTIYRKYRALNGVNADVVQLSYNSLCELDLSEEVTISKSCSFCYLLFYPDCILRIIYIASLLSLLFSMISVVLSVISL